MIDRGITNQRVIDALRTVPRERFFPDDMQATKPSPTAPRRSGSGRRSASRTSSR